MRTVKQTDPELFDIVQEEFDRQRTGIEMIASESYVPTEILELQGSIFTNKTMEGFPGNRFHAGFKGIDKMETLGIERAKALYGAEYANIQPHSGSQANQSVYAAMLNKGDTVMGMRLDQGGHLTHGAKVNFSGKIYDFHSYGLNRETEQIDYDELEKMAKELSPKLIVAGASSYPRIIDYKRMGDIAKSVNALFMVDMAHVAGLVAAGVLPSPVPHADFVTSTTTKTLSGARGGFVLCKEKYGKLLDKALFPGVQGSMHPHIMAAKAFTFKRAMSDEFKTCMEQTVRNAKALSSELQKLGFRIVTDGTDNHLLLADVRTKGLTGAQFEKGLEAVGITVNKNMIPFDTEKPMITSGVRIGATAVTIRGMKENEMVQIAKMMNEVAANIDDEAALTKIKVRSGALANQFPLYKDYFASGKLV